MRNLILRLTLLLAAVAVSFSAYAQQTVKGVVQDENGAPVAGVAVRQTSFEPGGIRRYMPVPYREVTLNPSLKDARTLKTE